MAFWRDLWSLHYDELWYMWFRIRVVLYHTIPADRLVGRHYSTESDNPITTGTYDSDGGRGIEKLLPRVQRCNVLVCERFAAVTITGELQYVTANFFQSQHIQAGNPSAFILDRKDRL